MSAAQLRARARTPAPPTPDDQHETSHLTRSGCVAWLDGHVEGRLGFETGRGPRSVVVGYTLRDGEVALLLPEYHPATGYLVGSMVTLEVEGPTGTGAWTSVHASGVGRLGPKAEAGSLHPYGACWPTGVAVHPVHVPLAHVDGESRPG